MPGEGEPPEIELEERALDVDGVTWTVRVEGRARVRTGGSGTPLLELVFRAAEHPPRTALAVGSSLGSLTDDHVADAVRSARPYDPDRAVPGFFTGTEQSGRTRGR